MGLFEISGNKTIELIPDKLYLTAKIAVTEFDVKDTEESKDKARTTLRDRVSDLAGDFSKKIGDICEISFHDISFAVGERIFDAPQSSFSFKAKKENVRLVNIDAMTNASIVINSRDSEVLLKVLGVLYDTKEVVNVYNSCSISNFEDIEETKSELRADICRKCRQDADVIASNLGSEVTGVDKIVYNSSGFLIKDSRTANTGFGVRNFNDVDIEEDGCFDEAFSSDIPPLDEQKRDYWLEGFVKSLLDYKFTMSDSITVGFVVK